LDDPERMTMDIVKEIYSFYPTVLTSAIGEEDELQQQLLQLPKLIEEYANNEDGETAYMFENVLEEGFNMFYDVEAHKIGGAGHTDIECFYFTRKKTKSQYRPQKIRIFSHDTVARVKKQEKFGTVDQKISRKRGSKFANGLDKRKRC
jgi:hypothetical protein